MQTALRTQEFVALAFNADGSLNSSTNPAQLGAVISIFVNGLAKDQVPSSSANFGCPSTISPACIATFQIYDLNSFLESSQPGSAGGLSFAGSVYVRSVTSAGQFTEPRP